MKLIDKLEEQILELKLDNKEVPAWMEVQLDRVKNVKLAMEYLSDAVNGMDTKDVASIIIDTLTAQHRTLQQGVFRAIHAMIVDYANLPDNYFDARNAESKNTCNQIAELDIYLPVI